MNSWPETAQKQTPDLEAYRRIVGTLPVTMRPALNQQLSQWETLFPFEQNRLAVFMNGVMTFTPSGLAALTAPLRKLEDKMGVKEWNFSESHDTIENASQLARSEYYAEWRREVQRIFEVFNSAAAGSAPAPGGCARLILLILPGSLPVDRLS